MPYTERKLKSGLVQVRSPHGLKSKGSTPENAQRQINLLRGVEHGWRPTQGRNAMARRMGM